MSRCCRRSQPEPITWQEMSDGDDLIPELRRLEIPTLVLRGGARLRSHRDGDANCRRDT